MIDKSEAIMLREQGRTYREISNILGCSEIWCKKLLKGVVKGKSPATSCVETKLKAIKILEDALKQLKGI